MIISFWLVQKKEGEMSDDMAEFIKRKRAAESGEKVDSPNNNSNNNQSDLEKQRRREEIMRRVEERKKKKQEEEGGGGVTLEPVVSEEVKIVSSKVVVNNNSPSASPAVDHSAVVEEERKKLTREFEVERARLLADISSLKTSLSSLSDQLNAQSEEWKKKEEQWKKEKREEEERVKEISNALSQSQSQSSSLQTQLTALHKEKEELEKAVTSLKQELSSSPSSSPLSPSPVVDDGELNRVKEELSQSLSSLSHLQTSLSQSQSDLSSTSSSLSSTKEELKKANEEIDRLKDQLADRDRTIIEAKGVVKQRDIDHQQSLQVNEDLLVDLQRENDDLKADYQSQLDDLKSQNSLLRQQLLSLSSSSSPSPSSSKGEKQQQQGEAGDRSKDVKKSRGGGEGGESRLIKEILAEINALRTSPSQYANKLKERISSFDGLVFRSGHREGSTIHTKEGVKALEEAIENLSGRSGVAALRYTPGLSASCIDLINSNGPAGIVSDKCSDGTTSEVRLKKYGKWKGKVIELTSYGPLSNSPEDILFQWILDDGNPVPYSPPPLYYNYYC